MLIFLECHLVEYLTRCPGDSLKDESVSGKEGKSILPLKYTAPQVDIIPLSVLTLCFFIIEEIYGGRKIGQTADWSGLGC